MEDVAREVLASRRQPALGELRDVGVDVAVVEALAHLAGEDRVEPGEVHAESGELVYRSGDGDVADVAVPVEARTRAEAEGGLVAGDVPHRATVAVRGGEGHAAREECGCHIR